MKSGFMCHCLLASSAARNAKKTLLAHKQAVAHVILLEDLIIIRPTGLHFVAA